MKNLESIGNLVKKSINKAGIQRQVEAAQICNAYLKVLKDIEINKIALEKSKAISYKDYILTIAVIGASLASELQSRQHIIRERINQKMGKELVNRIFFKIG